MKSMINDEAAGIIADYIIESNRLNLDMVRRVQGETLKKNKKEDENETIRA